MRKNIVRALLIGAVTAGSLALAPSVASAAPPCGFYNQTDSAGNVSHRYHNCSYQGKKVKIDYYGRSSQHVCVEAYQWRHLGYWTGTGTGALKGASVVGTCP
ncbi:hypothetical protein ACFFMR_32665 [Micromonospora andamanensis]|uniref:Secreted protein n=2 Tax=Micromonospora andamanensis TaxID=1287068 RepID=A0ABQ4I287_9ACTN|nr:hypothetical protein Van01_51800 [Micromonospora andamanensis]GIJ42557.1 hypothetical protein Vwe01_58820 [Micromonospora andamanensis]